MKARFEKEAWFWTGLQKPIWATSPLRRPNSIEQKAVPAGTRGATTSACHTFQPWNAAAGRMQGPEEISNRRWPEPDGAAHATARSSTLAVSPPRLVSIAPCFRGSSQQSHLSLPPHSPPPRCTLPLCPQCLAAPPAAPQGRSCFPRPGGV